MNKYIYISVFSLLVLSFMHVVETPYTRASYEKVNRPQENTEHAPQAERRFAENEILYTPNMPAPRSFSAAFWEKFKYFIAEREDVAPQMLIGKEGSTITVYIKDKFYRNNYIILAHEQIIKNRPYMRVTYFSSNTEKTRWKKENTEERIPLDEDNQNWTHKYFSEKEGKETKTVIEGSNAMLATALHEVAHAYVAGKYVAGSVTKVSLNSCLPAGRMLHTGPRKPVEPLQPDYPEEEESYQKDLEEYKKRQQAHEKDSEEYEEDYINRITAAGVAGVAIVYGYESPTFAELDENSLRQIEKNDQEARAEKGEAGLDPQDELRLIRRFAREAATKYPHPSQQEERDNHTIRQVREVYRKVKEELNSPTVIRTLKDAALKLYLKREMDQETFYKHMGEVMKQHALSPESQTWKEKWERYERRKREAEQWRTDKTALRKRKWEEKVEEIKNKNARNQEEYNENLERNRQEDQSKRETKRRQKEENYQRMLEENNQRQRRNADDAARKEQEYEREREEYYRKGGMTPPPSRVKRASEQGTWADINRELCNDFGLSSSACTLTLNEEKLGSSQNLTHSWVSAEGAVQLGILEKLHAPAAGKQRYKVQALGMNYEIELSDHDQSGIIFVGTGNQQKKMREFKLPQATPFTSALDELKPFLPKTQDGQILPFGVEQDPRRVSEGTKINIALVTSNDFQLWWLENEGVLSFVRGGKSRLVKRYKRIGRGRWQLIEDSQATQKR